MAENFTEKDKELVMKFGQFITEHAKFELTVPQTIEFSRLLVWYNSLPKKIEDNIMELKAIHNLKKEPEKKKEAK